MITNGKRLSIYSLIFPAKKIFRVVSWISCIKFKLLHFILLAGLAGSGDLFATTETIQGDLYSYRIDRLDTLGHIV